jgi:hypothetical protein
MGGWCVAGVVGHRSHLVYKGRKTFPSYSPATRWETVTICPLPFQTIPLLKVIPPFMDIIGSPIFSTSGTPSGKNSLLTLLKPTNCQESYPA